MFEIEPIKPITAYEVYKVLSSQHISDSKKADFIKDNSSDIEKILKSDISKEEFNLIMSQRPLIRFKPLKNSFTKKGDDIILAKSLGIKKNEINNYIDSVIASGFSVKDGITTDKIEELKTYVYRHGRKEQVIAFLEYELSDVKNTLQNLYKTLDNYSGGLAGYFSRPIHRMDNKTLSSLYRVIDKSLRNSYNAGYIDDTKFNSASEWALVKIYKIQNDSKVLRAYNLYKDMKL